MGQSSPICTKISLPGPLDLNMDFIIKLLEAFHFIDREEVGEI